VLLCFAPMILRTAISPNSERAQYIYFNIRSPHHYVPANFERDFLPFVAWNMMGVGAGLHLLRRDERGQRIGAVLAALSVLIWGGLVASTLVHVRQITSLLTWRMNPHCMLVLQAVASAGAATLLLDPKATRHLRPSDMLLFIAGLGLLAMNGG